MKIRGTLLLSSTLLSKLSSFEETLLELILLIELLLSLSKLESVFLFILKSIILLLSQSLVLFLLEFKSS